MTIHFKNGSFAECNEFEIIGTKIYWDGYRFEDLDEVERIEEN